MSDEVISSRFFSPKTLSCSSTITILSISNKLSRPTQTQVLVGGRQNHPSARRPLDEPQGHQIRFVDVFDHAPLLGQGGGERPEPHRTPVEFMDDDREELAVLRLQAFFVDIQELQGLAGYVLVDLPRSLNLGVIPGPLQEAVRHPGRGPRREREYPDRFRREIRPQYLRGARQYLFDVRQAVVLQAERRAESGAQRRSEEHTSELH